ELAPDERRDRIAGQAEDERLPAHAERDRFPRLDRDTPEHFLDPELSLDAPDKVVGTDRDTAGGDEDVELEPAPDRVTVCRLVVGDRVQTLDLGAGRLELRGEHQ